MADFALALPVILAHEGGAEYTDAPGDLGGPTKYGITQATLSRWRARPVAPEDVRILSHDEAAAIYRAWYWVPCGGESISDQLVATKCFDLAVSMGILPTSPNGQGGRSSSRPRTTAAPSWWSTA